ncbi:acyltransferase [Vibrio sp. Vb2535]|uniref:acyltransferase family protein n=1 Tax=Vibrio TaxID=662 RepID=UPI0029650134|nr:acyltransferase [Vibrio sp. Vb2535]MDW1755877.1 acyltransferase [Vibrio sp. Vb2535]
MYLNIQYIRALAAVLVLFAHTFGYTGAQGVDIFFIVSGFIMMNIIYNKEKSAKEFFIDRFLRIAPLYYIATAVAIAIGHANDFSLEHLVHSLLFLKLKWSSPVLSIGWTLDYEFIFYSVCSLSILFFKHNLFRVIFIVLVLFIGAFILDFILFPDKAYGHFIEFALGVGSYFVLTKTSLSNYFKLNVALVIISINLLFIVDIFIYDTKSLPYRFLGYGVLSAIFCTSFIALEGKIKKISFIKLIGDASFSIYIFHTIILHIYYETFNVYRYYSTLSDAISFILCIALGIIIHRKVENNLSKIIRQKRYEKANDKINTIA